jgi:hypothetical protein
MSETWRAIARPIIAKVLKETQGKDEKEIRKALTDSYPFGPRQYHPYKVWLDEIKIQRDKRQFGQRVHRDENNPNQLNIL